MDQAGIETGLLGGALDGAMVFAGPFDGGDRVVQLMLDNRLTDLLEGGLKTSAGMFDGLRGHQDGAIEVGEHELGACLGAIEAENAKVLGTDRLDALRQLPRWLLN